MAIKIKWETDGEDVDLPEEIHIPDEILSRGDDAVTDYLSEITGWMVLSWDGPVEDSSGNDSSAAGAAGRR